ncbi:MAG: hypothetical protein HQ514_11525 [Rhodospirillales bacterium]|nr:hypothetical protein [Rhodospirillales bacterium]
MTDSATPQPARQSQKGSPPDSDPGATALAALVRLLGRSAARAWVAQSGANDRSSDTDVPKETEE